MKCYQKMLIGLVVVVMITGAGVVWSGHGYHGYRDSGYDRWEGGFHGMGYGYGRMMDELSETDQEKAKAAIDTFRQSSSELRQTIYQKKMALEAEMAKPEPDAAAASDLLKEIATLKADVAQRWLEHRMEMKKIHPDLDRGFHQRGFGGKRGGKRGGGCRDCPSGRVCGFRN